MSGCSWRTRLLDLGGARARVGGPTECAALERFVAAVRAGEGRSLVLRGEAGIGKTALLQYLIESAPVVGGVVRGPGSRLYGLPRGA